MQKLFDLKLRAKASENSPANLDQMTRMNTNPSEIVASVAASVAAGTTGPSSYVTKPSLLDIPTAGKLFYSFFRLLLSYPFRRKYFYFPQFTFSPDSFYRANLILELDVKKNFTQGNQWHLVPMIWVSHWDVVTSTVEVFESVRAFHWNFTLSVSYVYAVCCIISGVKCSMEEVKEKKLGNECLCRHDLLKLSQLIGS